MQKYKLILNGLKSYPNIVFPHTLFPPFCLPPIEEDQRRKTGRSKKYEEPKVNKKKIGRARHKIIFFEDLGPDKIYK